MTLLHHVHHHILNQHSTRDNTRSSQLRIVLLHPILTATTPVVLANIVSKLELLYRHLALRTVRHHLTPLALLFQAPTARLSSVYHDV
jgi:hypothetical protein